MKSILVVAYVVASLTFFGALVEWEWRRQTPKDFARIMAAVMEGFRRSASALATFGRALAEAGRALERLGAAIRDDP